MTKPLNYRHQRISLALTAQVSASAAPFHRRCPPSNDRCPRCPHTLARPLHWAVPDRAESGRYKFLKLLDLFWPDCSISTQILRHRYLYIHHYLLTFRVFSGIKILFNRHIWSIYHWLNTLPTVALHLVAYGRNVISILSNWLGTGK